MMQEQRQAQAQTQAELVKLRAELSVLHRSGGSLYMQSPAAAAKERQIRELEAGSL